MTTEQDRDELRDELTGWPIGIGYYQTSVGVDEARDMADAILASPWLASQRSRAIHQAVALVCHGEQHHDEHIRYCVPLLAEADRIEGGATNG